MTHVAGWEIPGTPPPVQAAPRVDAPPAAIAARRTPSSDPQAPAAQTAQVPDKPKEKKGLFHRLLGVFK
jgi:hypothetical protein